ncbi:hypothetical protein HYR69_06985, partial [Candidatus Sumerlaeota bacterium]|nr:hypothetical protein [Candidatus Sumerlaeota bacterium]
VKEGPSFSATAQAKVKPGESFVEGKLAAINLAEKRARDQILLHVMSNKFPNGITLEEAIVTDACIQAKVYDTIRTAKITDKTINDDGMVTVTVELDLAPIMKILSDEEYAKLAAQASARQQSAPPPETKP